MAAPPRVLAVTGYWDIPGNKHGGAYRAGWLARTLRVNAPYVFFCDPAARAGLEPHRAGLPTTWVARTLDDIRARYPLGLYDPAWVHPVHLPCRDLGLVWLDKVDMVRAAAELAPPSVEWLAWVDAGLCTYRASPPPAAPWPRPGALDALPKGRVAYTWVREAYHSFAGTAWLVHRSIVPMVHRLFYEEVARVSAELRDWRVGADQLVWTRLRARRPELFHRLGEGYGEAVPLLGGQMDLPRL